MEIPSSIKEQMNPAPEGTYRVDAHCTNCGHKSQIQVKFAASEPDANLNLFNNECEGMCGV